ncbi:negative elongation factor D-like [Babylonia areolata]|uniref:negative elongation factor D-like n=1 Tax=Babylonia areolata TaxID=304850 RepID=UPI003FD21EA2
MADMDDDMSDGLPSDEGFVGSTDVDRSSGDEDEEDSEAVQQECISLFKSTDFIMEPIACHALRKFLSNGGAPEKVIELLSLNYHGVAQTINILAEWLIQSGVDLGEVKDTVETHLKEMILKHFDPKKADSVFYEEGSNVTQWLLQMIEFPTWRTLFYKLAEDYEDCLFLNLAIKYISDAGYQGEITSVSTACHQIEVFSRVLRTYISGFLEGGDDNFEKQLPEFTKMVCHGEHTYLYSQILMQILANPPHGCSNIRRLCQELEQRATEKGLDVTPITLALSGASAYPRAYQALSSMLSRKALNPADMTQLFKMYSEPDPPLVELIRVPAFLDLLIETLFKPGSHVNPEHKHKYIYLLAYAVSVFETHKKGNRKMANKEELKQTVQALDKTQSVCQHHRGASDLIADIGTLFGCLKFPVCAMGVLKWVDHTVSELSYFKLNTDHTPLHLVLVDEIGTNHPLLHTKALDLLVRLFESTYDELDVLVRLELKKMLLDRMVHLLSRGSAIPVVTYVRKCYEQQDTDISLIRHFVSEVLDVITPPYHPEFVQLFLPLIENKDITGYLRTEASKAGHGNSDPVTEFIRASS